MSDGNTGGAVIPAGWYPDPAGSQSQRWWNGTAWTGELQEPLPPAATSFGSDAPLARTQDAYVPMSAPLITKATAQTGIAYTRPAWWIVAHPIWGIVGQAVVYGIIDSVSPPPVLPTTIGFILLNLVMVAVLVRLAFADRSALYSGGNNSAASPWWILLSPLAYLVARAIEVKKWEVGGWAMVIWYAIALVLSPGLSALGIIAAFGLFAV